MLISKWIGNTHLWIWAWISRIFSWWLLAWRGSFLHWNLRGQHCSIQTLKKVVKIPQINASEARLQLLQTFASVTCGFCCIWSGWMLIGWAAVCVWKACILIASVACGMGGGGQSWSTQICLDLIFPLFGGGGQSWSTQICLDLIFPLFFGGGVKVGQLKSA